jgi:hypothetical protein
MEEDLEPTQILNHSPEGNLTEPSEAAAAKTAKLPRLDSGAFKIERGRERARPFDLRQVTLPTPRYYVFLTVRRAVLARLTA